MIISPMLVVVAFHKGDSERTKNLFQWIKELGGIKPHSILLVVEPDVEKPIKDEISKLAKESSDFVMIVPPSVKCAWAPNRMFLSAAKWVSECTRIPWLWLEPDATPLKEGWADAVMEEYENSPMKFLGPIVRQTGQAGLPSAHLTGTAVYPPEAWETYQDRKSLFEKVAAWDIEAADKIVPRSKHSLTIQHYWGMKDMPPIFVESRTDESPKNFVTLDFIKKESAIFHRVKDGSLITLLRKQRNAKTKTSTPPKT